MANKDLKTKTPIGSAVDKELYNKLKKIFQRYRNTNFKTS